MTKAENLFGGDVATLLDRGLTHHRAGRLDAAMTDYGDVLARAPGHPSALHLLGVTAHQAGDPERATILIGQAISNDPSVAAYHNHLGAALLATARHDEAIVAIGRALEINPQLAEAHYNLGIALSGARRITDAEASLRRAIAIKPDHDKAYNNLGGVLKAGGRMEEALTAYRTAARINPLSVQAQTNLAVVQHETGFLSEAITTYRKAIAISPDDARANGNLAGLLFAQGDVAGAEEASRRALKTDPACNDALKVMCALLRDRKLHVETSNLLRRAIDANPTVAGNHNNLAITLFEIGDRKGAMAALRRAIELKPDYADAHSNLSHLLLGSGQADAAFESSRKAIALAPDRALFWARWAECLPRFSFAAVDAALFRDLEQLLDQPGTLTRSVAGPVSKALLRDPEISRLLAVCHDGSENQNFDYWSTAENLSSIPLLLRILSLSPINSLDLEAILTFLRRAVLRAVAAGDRSSVGLSFTAALALHCFTNEYVFTESDDEHAAVTQLRDSLASIVENDDDPPPSWVAVLGAYMPLFKLPWAAKLLGHQWSDSMTTVITRQVVEPLEEQSLRQSIPSLTPICDAVSQAVRDQYEENPYPRWVKPATSDAAKPLTAILQELGLHADTGAIASAGRIDVLIAGCGSGQHALTSASRIENAVVLAMDLSLTSLAYAVRKTRELGVQNIEYAQGDILELAALDRKFDVIECGGVLHHLDDPLAGWRNLVTVLRSGGLMKIGLYSEIARQPIARARALISERQYEPSPEGIRRCRREIVAEKGKNQEPELVDIHGFTDFYSLSECRDLLFHVQEHRFTLTQINNALHALNLRFLGFEHRDWAVITRFKQIHPDPDALTSLPMWHKFETENPQAFSSMYQFWVQKV